MIGSKRKCTNITNALEFSTDSRVNTAACHVSANKDDLGLTATIEQSGSCSEVRKVPEAFSRTCLQTKELGGEPLLKLAKHVFHKLSKKNSSTDAWDPSPIQLQSWPILQHNLNLIAIATTGSGKTLGYAVPMVDSCMNSEKKSLKTNSIHGLVLLPTRELAIQVSKVLKAAAKSGNKLSGKNNIAALPIYGGVDREEQIDSLTQRKDGISCQFLVAATPLRLIDLLGIGECGEPNKRIQKLFERTRYLVVDEADRMATQADMSEQVEKILNFLQGTSKCLEQKCLFSATLPRRAVSKCNDWIDKPRVTVKVDTVTVGNRGKTESSSVSKDNERKNSDDSPMIQEDEEDVKNNAPTSAAKNTEKNCQGPLDLSTIPAHISQIVHACSNHKKPKKLCTTLKKIRDGEKKEGTRRKGLIIIFFARIKTLQYIHKMLQKERVQCVPFHSQMNQQKRESQLNAFRSGKTPILLATDIAARGLHCNNVEYIINYDFPGSLDQYVHRCGRAGRNKVSGAGGEEGKKLNAAVYSFFHRELAPMAPDLIALLRSCQQWIDPNLVSLVPGGVEGFESKRKRRKRGKMSEETLEVKSNPISAIDDAKKTTSKNINMDSEDEFAFLGQNRIVLERASHVADDSDDSN